MKRILRLVVLFSILAWCRASTLSAADASGLNLGMGNLYRVSKAKSRSISPENFTGEKGKAGMATEGTGKSCARELGQGWKVSPSVRIKAKTTFTLGEIKGPGCIQQIWMTPTGNWRALDPALLLGRRNRALRRMPGGRFLRLRLGQVLPDQLAGRVREPGQRLQLLLADAVPQEGPKSRWRTSMTRTWRSITRSTTR